MMQKGLSYTLEIIAFCIEACQVAAANGADRIELCDNPGDGGTTPSAGMIRAAVSSTPVPVFPIIRPRGGDFLYSDLEFRIMMDDVACCRDAGCQGVVLGLLRADGRVDIERTARLVERAGPMAVTFHRAFDRVADPFGSLEDVIAAGCRRILTSGCRPSASAGIAVLAELQLRARGRILIMPGAGIRADNIARIAEATGVTELHSSASIRIGSRMDYVNPLMQEELSQVMPDAEGVRAMRQALSRLCRPH